LGEGVYAVYLYLDKEFKKGMMSIGNRPTFNDTSEKVEVNIFDFEEEIYGKTVKVIVKKYLRAQEKYNSIEALKAQIDLDKIESLKQL
jgi:FAD synthase